MPKPLFTWRWRFSLAGLMTLVSIACVWFWHLGAIRREKEATAEIESLGGSVTEDGWFLFEDERDQHSHARKSVVCWGPRFGDAQSPLLSRIRGVTDLSLAYSSMTDEGIASLPRMPELVGLDVSGANISDPSIGEIASKCPNLEALVISSTKIRGDGLEELRRLRRIKSVDASYIDGLHVVLNEGFDALENFDVEHDGVVEFRAIGLPRLQGIDLVSYGQLRAVELRDLPSLASVTIGASHPNDNEAARITLKNLPAIRTVYLCGPADRELLSMLGELRTLTSLSLWIGDFDAMAFPRLASLRSLQSLSLHRSYNVRDDNLNWIGQLGELQELDLSDTEIDGSICDKLRSLRRLRRLNISGCKLESASFAKLSALKQVEFLNAYQYETDERLLPAIGKMKGLREVVLKEHQFSGAEMEGLKESIPRLRVTVND